ncbi:PLAT domain-containing protein 3-like [Prosopis cineraria]|uniref:PLAT domain-containing protein 3-like n=1 Tax=Prosopis cineraria TaxID=364024 RepID=UPI00240FD092|nr:PLAT domain-containing protein 3-like [Prosopis cineraria]
MLLKISFFSLLLPFFLAARATSRVAQEDECVYTAYIRTGSIFKAGTDSTIGLQLYDSYGYAVWIKDLQSWGGLMGAAHDYFERGNLDIFSGRGPCLKGSVCGMNLTSDGWGAHHGWYCNYVEVTSTGPHLPCAQQLFTVEQWLARDAWPYRLWSHRDLCPNSAPALVS